MKIIIHLSVPVIQYQSDLQIPASMKVGDLIQILTSSIHEASSKFYPVTGQEVLCHLETHCVLNKETPVSQSGVKNGHHLVLI